MVEPAAVSAPLIDWSALLTVALLSIVIGIFGVSIYSFGVVGVNEYARRARGGHGLGGVALAVACFAIALASVAVGLFLIVDKTWKP